MNRIYHVRVMKKGADVNDDPVLIPLEPGTIRFIVGPNGTGKTALMQRAAAKSGILPMIWVHAQRSVRFNHDSVELTPASFLSEVEQTRRTDQTQHSRYYDEKINDRLTTLLYKLHYAEIERSKKFMELAESERLHEAEEFRRLNLPTITICDRFLKEATLTFQIKNEQGLFLASHDNERWFTIRRLSDGERAALLLAAEVLLAEKQALLLIDEPERHLHRSISAPLLASIFSERRDCAFLIATHDFDLVIGMPNHRVMLMRGVKVRDDGEVVEFDYDELENADELGEEAKRSIVGGRRKLLFTEGESEKLDLPIYGALFPKVTVRAVGSAAEVIQSVRGLRASGNDHWLQAYGIVDLDQKIEEGADLIALRIEGVHALNVHSVESLYYGTLAQSAVATYKARIEKRDPQMLLNKAKSAVLQNLCDSERVLNLASYRAVGRLRGALLKHLPTREQLKKQTGFEKDIKLVSPLKEEVKVLEQLVTEERLDDIISRYKIRESGARQVIAANLLCRDTAEYEALVVHLLLEDKQFNFAMVRQFGTLAEVLS